VPVSASHSSDVREPGNRKLRPPQKLINLRSVPVFPPPYGTVGGTPACNVIVPDVKPERLRVGLLTQRALNDLADIVGNIAEDDDQAASVSAPPCSITPICSSVSPEWVPSPANALLCGDWCTPLYWSTTRSMRLRAWWKFCTSGTDRASRRNSESVKSPTGRRGVRAAAQRREWGVDRQTPGSAFWALGGVETGTIRVSGFPILPFGCVRKPINLSLSRFLTSGAAARGGYGGRTPRPARW
jgi:hypothetical protein